MTSLKTLKIIFAGAALALALAACSAGGPSLSADSTARVLRAGGTLTVSAGQYSTDSLVRFARAAQEGGGAIRITGGGGLSVDSLARIAAAAPGHVEYL